MKPRQLFQQTDFPNALSIALSSNTHLRLPPPPKKTFLYTFLIKITIISSYYHSTHQQQLRYQTNLGLCSWQTTRETEKKKRTREGMCVKRRKCIRESFYCKFVIKNSCPSRIHRPTSRSHRHILATRISESGPNRRAYSEKSGSSTKCLYLLTLSHTQTIYLWHIHLLHLSISRLLGIIITYTHTPRTHHEHTHTKSDCSLSLSLTHTHTRTQTTHNT